MKLVSIAEPQPILCKDSANQVKYKIKTRLFFFRAQPFLWNKLMKSEWNGGVSQLAISFLAITVWHFLIAKTPLYKRQMPLYVCQVALYKRQASFTMRHSTFSLIAKSRKSPSAFYSAHILTSFYVTTCNNSRVNGIISYVSRTL